MSSVGTSKAVLEIVKFAVYVSVPIGFMYLFANNNNNLQKIMDIFLQKNQSAFFLSTYHSADSSGVAVMKQDN